jgi:hypothetical protein
VLAPREIDEYLLPTERRVIRVRQHWAVMAKDLIQTGLSRPNVVRQYFAT